MAKAKILFVDDEPRIVRLLEMLFRKDYDVLTATSGAEALEIISREAPHVVVSDQRMPRMTGIELLSKIRQTRSDIVRILLTGYSDLVAIIGAVNEGEVYRFVNKPWNEAELSQTIKEAVAIALDARGLPASHELGDDDAGQLASATKLLAIDGVGNDRLELLEMFTDDYNVLSARSIDDALATLRKHTVGVIVADFESTSEEAVQLCSSVREHYPNTTIVLMAHSTDSETIVRLINEAQIYRFAMRPVTPNVFRLAVSAAMNEYHRRLARKHHLNTLQTTEASVDNDALELSNGLAEGIKSSLGRFTKVW